MGVHRELQQAGGWGSWDGGLDGDWEDIEAAALPGTSNNDETFNCCNLTDDTILLVYERSNSLWLAAIVHDGSGGLTVTKTEVVSSDAGMSGRYTIHKVPGSSTDFVLGYYTTTSSAGTYAVYGDFTSGTFNLESPVLLHTAQNAGVPMNNASEGLTMGFDATAGVYTVASRVISPPGAMSSALFASTDNCIVEYVREDFYVGTRKNGTSNIRAFGLALSGTTPSASGDQTITGSVDTHFGKPIRLDSYGGVCTGFYGMRTMANDGSNLASAQGGIMPEVWAGDNLGTNDDGDIILGTAQVNLSSKNDNPVVQFHRAVVDDTGEYTLLPFGGGVVDSAFDAGNTAEHNCAVVHLSDGFACYITTDITNTKFKAKVLVRP